MRFAMLNCLRSLCVGRDTLQGRLEHLQRARNCLNTLHTFDREPSRLCPRWEGAAARGAPPRGEAEARAEARTAAEGGAALREVYREVAAHVAGECTYKTCNCLAVSRAPLTQPASHPTPTSFFVTPVPPSTDSAHSLWPSSAPLPQAFELRRYAGLPVGLSLPKGSQARAQAEQHITDMKAAREADLADAHTQQQAVAALARQAAAGGAAGGASASGAPEGFSMLAVRVSLPQTSPRLSVL